MKKYLIDEVEVTEEQFEREFEEAARESAQNSYNDMLDETSDEVIICGYSYSPSIAFYRVDPIAYNCGLSDYESYILEDNSYYLDRDGSVIVDGKLFEVVEYED